MNHDIPGGSGGAGIRLQATVGIVNVGTDVGCANVLAPVLTLHDQSHSRIVPGAEDVLPLNVQSSAVPLLAIAQVSDPFAPSTPKTAVAPLPVIVSVAVAEDPP
jgi:hypothetical protein